MKLLPLDTPEVLELVARWLAEKENHEWLDFGADRGQMTPAFVKVMAQRPNNVLRVFTADDERTPIGVVGLNNVNRRFKTAMVWVVLGDKSHARKGYATRAVSKMLTLGFEELGLGAINTWNVENNPSITVTERNNFRFIGRQRQCHSIDGRPHDRLLFDILACEHKELEDGGSARIAGSNR